MICQKIFLSHVPKSAGCSIKDAFNPDAVLHWSPLLHQKGFCMERYISENSYLNFFKISSGSHDNININVSLLETEIFARVNSRENIDIPDG